MKLLAMFVVSLLVALAAVPALAQQSPQSTFRDDGGRTTGTATTPREPATQVRDVSEVTDGPARCCVTVCPGKGSGIVSLCDGGDGLLLRMQNH